MLPWVLSIPFFPQIQVFHLGEGMDSKNWMSRNKGDTGTMYLKHIKEVLGFIAMQYWGLQVLMWDDMLRKISVGALRGERMGTAVLAPKPGVSAPVHMTTLTRCLAEAHAWLCGGTGLRGAGGAPGILLLLAPVPMSPSLHPLQSLG